MKLIPVILVGIALALGAGWQGGPAARAQTGTRIALDADITNGVCDTVDANVRVPKGATVGVAVCLLNAPEPAEALEVRVTYDISKVTVPERPDDAPALDDNPDANAGATTFGSQNLGTGWDCTGFGAIAPVGEDPGTPSSDAHIVCNANLSSPDEHLSNGAMAVIFFQTGSTAGGVSLAIDPVTSVAGHSGGDYAECLPTGGVQVPCDGATLTISGEVATPSPTVAPATAAAASATSAAIQQTAEAGNNGANAGGVLPAETQTALAQITPANPATGTAVAQALTGAQAAASSEAATAKARASETPAATPRASSSTTSKDGGGGNGKTIAIIIGVVAAVAIAGGGGAYYWFRMRRPT